MNHRSAFPRPTSIILARAADAAASVSELQPAVVVVGRDGGGTEEEEDAEEEENVDDADEEEEEEEEEKKDAEAEQDGVDTGEAAVGVQRADDLRAAEAVAAVAVAEERVAERNARGAVADIAERAS
ncbi:hypothetical protein HDU90_006679 [Geranomyces variabilis]|nr:hypothetical protein HDU90_006679 [Geranomyces variabilis]